MMRNDYSQLAVMSGPRDLRGAVSWEAIAQARIRDPQAGLREAVINHEVVRSEDDLLAQIPRIVDAGFVFVQAADRQVAGIVTTADLSHQFAILAKPFFVLAEIERRLRRIVDGALQSDELQAVIDPADATRPVKSAEDLTLGEYVRLLEDSERWPRLGWALDRKVFIDGLHKVRAIRNEVMHFSPDPLDDDQVITLENFVKWLRKLSLNP
jgi:restriction system protein